MNACPLWFLLASVMAAAPSGPRKDLFPGGQRLQRMEMRERAAQPSDEDVQELLRDWSIFEAAMSRLHVPDARPEPPKRGLRVPRRAEVAPDAEAAWLADRRVREAFAKSGSTPERFVDVYRRVADAWWLLHERETREETAAALSRALEHVPAGEGAAVVREELEQGLRELQSGNEGAEPAGLDVIRRHRAALERVFSPAAAP